MARSNPLPPSLAVWIAIALLLRLIWVLHLPATDSYLQSLPDQREYLELGRNLLHGRGLYFHDPRFDADVFAYRTPGYPAFIALCGGSVRIVRIAQAFIDTSSVLAVYIIARRWLSIGRSRFAAAVVALNPMLIFFSGLLLAETLFIALLIWGMALLTPGHKTGKGLLLLTLAILVRPSALLLPVLFAVSNPPFLRAYHWPRAIFAVLMIFMLLFPWAFRNHLRLGAWIWTTTNGGITLYDGFNPAGDGSSDQSFVAALPQLKHMTELARSSHLLNLARQFIRENPARVQVLTLNKILRTWSPIPLSRKFGRDPSYVLIGLLYTLPLFILTLLGLLNHQLPPAAKVFLMLPAVYITLLVIASVGSIRYRVPADVPMAVVAAAGVPKWKRESRNINPPLAA